ncbi:MAG TPA: PIN domain-containing protein [Dehalococcoidia bacterium]|nr:PIN domain-containing protein [Dehalococcoidia bacterium]
MRSELYSELYLVDTSIWLEVLPPGRGSDELRGRIDELLAADMVATMGMVKLELLGGARSLEEWQRLDELLSALHPLPVTEVNWQDAARMGFQLRRQGISVPFTDLLIAAVATAAPAILVHRDRHFDFIAAHLPLDVESHLAYGAIKGPDCPHN